MYTVYKTIPHLRGVEKKFLYRSIQRNMPFRAIFILIYVLKNPITKQASNSNFLTFINYSAVSQKIRIAVIKPKGLLRLQNFDVKY